MIRRGMFLPTVRGTSNMPTRNFLYRTQYEINNRIRILIPKVGDVLDNEDNYYNAVNTLTAMPVDFIVQLEGLGIDFTEINDYELFLLMFEGLKGQDTGLIFDGLDLKSFTLDENKENGQIFLVDKKSGIMIDRFVQNQIAAALRKIHHLTKNRRMPANKEAKSYMIRRAKEKAKRRKNKTEDSYLESLITAMVNTEQYKYNFEETRELSIYQFNESVLQIIKKIKYDQQMHGVYFGTVDVDKLSQDDLNWLVHK